MLGLGICIGLYWLGIQLQLGSKGTVMVMMLLGWFCYTSVLAIRDV